MQEATRSRRFDIQGLRAVASLLVASYHVWFGSVSGGVDAFFAIGGFLLATSLAGELERTGRIDVPLQLRRTAKRLLPMAGIVILVVGLVAMIAGGPLRLRQALGDVLAAATFTENWRLAASATAYVDAGHDKSALQHFWAMGAQGQFTVLTILAVGALGVLLGRRARRHGRAAIAVLLGAVVIASFWYASARLAADPVPTYYDTFARAWELALGGFAALVLTRIPLHSIARALLAAGGMVLLLTAGLLPVEWAQPGLVSLWPVAGALLVLVAGRGADAGPAARMLRWRPLVWLGGISYGVYLWHWPLLKGLIALDPTQAEQVGVIEGAGVIAIAVALSWWSARLLARLGRAKRSSLRTAAPLLVPTLAAAAAVGLLVAPSLQERAIRDGAADAHPAGDDAELQRWIADAVSAPPVPTFGAVGPTGLPSEWLVDRCTSVWEGLEDSCRYDGSADLSREVWLVGDSHAVSLALPVRQALEGTADVQLLGLAGCPFSQARDVELQKAHDGGDFAECAAHIERVMGMAEDRRPDLVIVTYGAWWAGPGFEHLEPGLGERLADGTLSLTTRLEALGIATLWVDGPPPVSMESIERCVSAHRAKESTEDCTVPLERAQLERHEQMVVALRAGGVDVIDSLGWYCDVERLLCPLVVNGVPTWADDLHLGAAGAMQRVLILSGEVSARVH